MSNSLEDNLDSQQASGEGEEEEDSNKPKQAIIIPQKGMKSPLDVVNTYPSKFQNGTFKAHSLEESDNEESDTNTNGSGSVKHSSYHKQSSSSSSSSKQTHKKVEEARKVASQAKAELNLLKIKQDLQTLRTNELLAQLFHAIDVSYSNIIQDDQLKENFSLLLSVYVQQKDEYNKLMFPPSTEQAKIPTAHESVMEAEYLVEKTLENFEEEQGKQNDNPVGLRVYPSEIALKEKQLEHMQEQLDIDSKKSMSQSSLSDDYPVNSNVTVEDENAQLKEQNQFLKITAENIKKQLSLLQGREASYDLQDSQIQELRSILAKQNGEVLSDKQAFDAKVAERLQLTQRLNRLEKKVKLLSTENVEIKNSLKVFSLENLKLEKKLEIEKKSNEMLFAFTNGEESDLINGLNLQVEKLKEQVSDLLKEKDTLEMQVLASEEEINFIKSNGHSRELDTMEEDFDKQEDVKKNQWNLKMIQAKSMVLEERQNIEQEKKDITERIAKISEEKEELQKQNENLLRDNSQSKICYKTVEKQFKDAVKENDKLKKKQSEFEDKSKKLAELQEETENLQEQLKELETLKKEKENFQKEQQLKEKELEEIKKSLSDVEIELTSAKKLSSETTLLMQQQKQQLLEQQQPSSQQEQESSDDPSKVSELQAELDDKIKQIHQIELQKQSYQNENATFRSTYKRLEKQLRKSIKEKEALRKDLEHEKQLFVEQSAGGDQRVLEILKKEIKTLTEERDEVNKRNAKLEGKMKQLSQEASMKKMENEFDEEVQVKIEKAKSQVLEEKQVLETEKSEIAKKLEDTVLAKNLLQIKSEAILSENQAFHQNLSSIQKQLKAALKERDAVTQERNNIKQEIVGKDGEIEKLKEQIQVLNEKTEKQQAERQQDKIKEEDSDDDEMDHSLLIQQKDKVIAEKESIIEDMMRVKQQLDTRAMIAERELLGKSKELEEVKNQLQAKITELESKSQELEGTNNLEKFEEEFDETEKVQSSNVEEKLKEIVQQKSRVELENAGTKENYKALEKEFRRQLKMCDELRKKLSESDEKCKEFEDKNAQLEERSQELCQEKDEAVKQLKNQKQVEQPPKQQQSEQQSQGSQEISEDTRLMLADLKLENQALLIEQNIQKKTNDKLENEINQLREELKMEDMDDEFEDETKAAASIIEEKDKVIDQLHKSTTAISQENTGLKSTFKSLEKELRRQVKECDEGKKALKRMESEKQALEEKLAEYETKFGTINEETQEAEVVKEATGDSSGQNNTLSTESAQQFEELKVKYETMLREQEEFTRVQMLEFEEKEHQMEISKSEIEQEKNDLERKANSITQEQSQQKLFYASLEKQFRRFIKDSDVLKKQVNVLQKFKGKIEEIVSVLQIEDSTKGGEGQQIHDQGDGDSDVDDDRLLQYDILGLVKKQIADLENSKQAQQECKDNEERLREQIEEIQGRQQEQTGKSQKLEDMQIEIARLQRELDELRKESENGVTKANNEIEASKQQLNAAQEKLANANQRLKEQENELLESKQEKILSQGSERQNVEALTIELSKYQGEVKELGDKSRQANDRIKELEKIIAGFEDQKQQQQRVVVDKENEIKELQLRINEELNHSKELQEQLSQQEEKSTHLLQGQQQENSMKNSNNNNTATNTPLKNIDQSEECRRLKQRLAEKESRVGEIEKKLSELVQRIDEQNKEISEQYNIIEVLQKSGEDNNEDDTPGIIAELEVEKRICDQYREQCEIIKRKCEILEVNNADLSEKLRKREEKLTAQMAQLRTLNTQLIKQNELLKDDRQAMIADLEGLMITKESLVQNQQVQQQMYPKRGGQDGSGNQQQSRKPKSTTDLYDEEMNYNSNSKQAKIKNKIYEFNQKVFDDVDPQLFEQGQQQPFEEHLEDNDSLYSAKLARLEDDFHKEVQSLKSIIKSKETEIVQLKVKEQIQQKKQQSQQQPNNQLLTPREKKSKQNSSPSRKSVPAKIDTNNNNNTSNNIEHFTNMNEYGIERRSKNHSAQSLQQQQQQQQIQNQQMLQYQQQQQQLKPITQQVDAQRRHKQQQHQIQSQQQQQQLLLSTAAINQSASSALERQRKSMPQMQFVSGMQQGKGNNANTSNIVGNSGLVLGNNNNNSTNSSSSSTINNISPGDLNSNIIYNIDANSHNHYSTQSNKNIRSNNQMINAALQPGNVSAHSFTNINNNNNNNSSGTGNNNSFLDQMYLKCIERSKNLLHKNETLLRSLKAPNLMASPVQQQQQAQLTTATSILANQAKIQANQDQLHSAIMQTTSIKTPGQQQQQQLIISPSQSVHNSCAVDSLSLSQWKQQQPSSPQEHYFPNKQQQQEQQQQQLQFAGSASAAQGYSNSGKNTKTMRSPMSATAATAPLISQQQNQMLSPISPVKLDYAKLILQGSEQQFPQGQGSQQQSQLNGGNSNTSKNSNNFNQQPSSSPQVPRYEGDLLGNSRDGTGCYFYNNGEIYEGEWKQDKRHGYGILKDEFGIDIYNGEWAYDMYDGQGRLRNRFMQLIVSTAENSKTMDYSNIDALVRSWQFYSGEFKNNLMHGQGTLLLGNNEKFIGQFENGRINGEGQYYAQNGEVITAIWNGQRLVQNAVQIVGTKSNNNIRY